MMVHIPEVLTPQQVARCREVMAKAEWVDGRITAGHQSAQVKKNLQLPETAPEARELGDMVLQALGRSALFFSAVLPKQVFPPLFNRYDAGMTFGAHVDNAIRGYLDTPLQIRTDISATLFRALGLDPHQELNSPTGRPITLFREGKVIEKLLA